MTFLDLLAKYREGLLQGLLVTLRMSLVVWMLGLIFGALLGWASARSPKVFGRVTSTTGFFLSGIPILVLLFWLHYPAQALLGIVVKPFWTAVATFSLVNTFAVAQIVAPAIRDFPRQYITAARVAGVPRRLYLRKIVWPLIVRGALPGLLFSQVSILQATLFSSLISVNEIFRVVQQINALEHVPVQAYSGLAVLFLILCLPLNGIAVAVGRQTASHNLSER